MQKDLRSCLPRDLEIVADRRERLCKNPPRCISCGHEQVQLLQWIRTVEWRCRICKHWWKDNKETLGLHASGIGLH